MNAIDRTMASAILAIGLRHTERIGEGIAFLSSSEKHHTLALQALGETAGPQRPGSVGLYHLAFELPDATALEDALDRLDEEGVVWQTVDHGVSWAAYFDDPDGNGLELYVDRRHHQGGRHQWGGVTTRLSRERIHQAAETEAATKASKI